MKAAGILRLGGPGLEPAAHLLEARRRAGAGRSRSAPAKCQGEKPSSSGASSRATSSIASRTRAMLPSPPHWASSRPPPRRARARIAPQALVVGHPVECGRGHDRVDLPVELSSSTSRQQTSARAPRRCAGQLHHLAGGVDGQHPPARDQPGEQLGDATGAASDVEHGGVGREPAEARQHVAGPLQLGLADAVVGGGVPGGARSR